MIDKVRTAYAAVSKQGQSRKERKYSMKKKFMAVLLAGMMVLAAGCGSKEGKVTVGEYKGLALTGVTQADIDAEIDAMLDYYTELAEVDRAAAEGDTVNINYVGLKDGVAFEGGTDDSEAGTDLKLGSNSFIDGFEEGLIGVVAGEKRDLNLTFPEDYGNEELNGQAVVFQVTVNAVKEEVVPELNDAFIAENIPEFSTVDEYMKELRENMNYTAYYEQITELLMESSEVSKYNEKRVAERKAQLIAEYTSYAEYYGSYYGLDTETAIMYFLGFESTEAFEEEMGNYAYDVEKNAMIISEIAKLEGIELTDEIYNEKVVEYVAAYGVEDEAALKEQFGEETVNNAILSELVMDFLIENAVITEAE